MKVYVLVGAPGSGKSTYTKELLKKHSGNAVILSSDYFRVKMFGSRKVGNEAHNSTRVFEEMHRNLKNLLGWNQYEAVIYDATNLSRNRRRALYNNVKTWSKGDAEIEIIYFSMPLSRLIKNNSKRSIEEFVPEHLIKQMYINQQVPRTGVDCDCFNVVGIAMFDNFNINLLQNGKEMLMDLVCSSVKVMGNEIQGVYSPHDCLPYHLESIDEHISMCIDNSMFGNNSEQMVLTSLFHDLGKSITKEMIEKDGLLRATYRGHEHLSSNYLLNYLYYSSKFEKYNDLIEIIHQHMLGHKEMGTKNIRKNKLDEDLLNKITEFSMIDNKSRITQL